MLWTKMATHEGRKVIANYLGICLLHMRPICRLYIIDPLFVKGQCSHMACGKRKGTFRLPVIL